MIQNEEFISYLKELFPTAYCELKFNSTFELLIAVILSAQCTDRRVNMVTKELFKKYNTPEQFVSLPQEKLEQEIKSCGFYHNKAKNLIACCKDLRDKFGGEVPQNIEELTSLAGVGRKTANVIRGNIYQEPSIVVDTHVKRISKKLGITRHEDPEKVEFDLMKKLPKEHWILYNIQLITLGREICKAPTPRCEECFLTDVCSDYQQRRRHDKKLHRD